MVNRRSPGRKGLCAGTNYSVILWSSCICLEYACPYRMFFLSYAQTNYLYISEQCVHQKLDDFFSQPQQTRPCDTSWICTIPMVFAVGTQFAHLSSQQSSGVVSRAGTAYTEDSSLPEDAAALTFYHAAKKLIPDVIALASIESAQAFLLLAVYALPIDPAGLSYTYIGLAVKIAIRTVCIVNTTRAWMLVQLNYVTDSGDSTKLGNVTSRSRTRYFNAD